MKRLIAGITLLTLGMALCTARPTGPSHGPRHPQPHAVRPAPPPPPPKHHNSHSINPVCTVGGLIIGGLVTGAVVSSIAASSAASKPVAAAPAPSHNGVPGRNFATLVTVTKNNGKVLHYDSLYESPIRYSGESLYISTVCVDDVRIDNDSIKSISISKY